MMQGVEKDVNSDDDYDDDGKGEDGDMTLMILPILLVTMLMVPMMMMMLTTQGVVMEWIQGETWHKRINPFSGKSIRVSSDRQLNLHLDSGDFNLK